jgi:hypothetical protein
VTETTPRPRDWEAGVRSEGFFDEQHMSGIVTDKSG